MPGASPLDLPRPPLAAIGLLSAAVLAYEVLLMRLFAIVHWHHFAFMMISIALLGYGASGTLLTLIPSRSFKHLKLVFLSGALGFSITSVLCFAAAQRLPFNALEVFWDPRQWGYLAGIYGLLCVPFCMAASGIGAALKFHAHPLAQIYAADLAGAGLGACIAAGLLFHLPPSFGLVLVSAGGIAAAVIAGHRWQASRGFLIAAAAVGAILAGMGVAGWPELAVNAYKPVTQTLRRPGAHFIYARNHPMGWISAVASPAIPLRHAPGLSLISDAAIPEQMALFVDGQGLQVVDRFDGQAQRLDYLRQTLGSIGLHLRSRPQRVLIANAGGGQDILRALAYDAGQIVAVDPHPLYPRILKGELRAFSGWTHFEGRLRYHSTAVRSFLQSSAENEFNLIQISPTGSSGSGAAASGANTLLTAEGLGLMWQHLAVDGLIVLPLWTRLPPRSSLKAFLMALTMLERQGIREPAAHLAMIRDWRMAVILIGRSPLSDHDLAAIRAFCRQWGFDLAYLPDLGRVEVNRHAVLPQPVFAEATRALAGEGRADFIARYKFDLRVPTDDRPFFGHFFRWQSLPEIAALRRAGGSALLDWGYPVLLATLAQAILFSLVLMGLPALWSHRDRAAKPTRSGGTIRTLLYFSAIGGGFIFLEVTFIQRLTLFLHHPLLAVTLTLGGFLIGAGGGSLAAHRCLERGFEATGLLRRSLLVIILVGLLELLALPGLIARGIGMALGYKLLLALGLILPLAAALGMAFPLGMAALTRRRSTLVPWAWGINGCATVIGAVAVPLLARHTGYTAAMVLGLLFYAAGFSTLISTGD
jgi:hypothetical protein